MMKFITFCVFLLLLSAACSSLPFQKEKDVRQQDIVINMVPEKVNISDSGSGYLIITNASNGKQWEITHYEFKVWKRGYNNWRELENQKPVITNVNETENHISFTFNYFRINEDGSKASILAGDVIINKKYLRTIKDEQEKEFYKNALIGTGSYAILTTGIIIIMFL